MKLSNIFKKSTKVVATANVEKMDKKQLEKVVGGTDTTSTIVPTPAVDLKTKHDTVKNSIQNIR